MHGAVRHVEAERGEQPVLRGGVPGEALALHSLAQGLEDCRWKRLLLRLGARRADVEQFLDPAALVCVKPVLDAVAMPGQMTGCLDPAAHLAGGNQEQQVETIVPPGILLVLEPGLQLLDGFVDRRKVPLRHRSNLR